ncbi:MAG: alpha/beta hydrolase [Cyclobacteriaceae bacterium]|nr:alpha/beta hydrolase [Cyclobacteriaceae bacterium]
MFICDLGTGKPVVLLHGFCETHRIWLNIAQRLSGSFRILIPDLPGFGKSDPLTPPFSIDDVATHVLKQLDLRKVENMVLFGHSLGGYVALAMAQLEPLRVSGIGLVHSTALPDSEERKMNRNRVAEFIGQHGTEPFVRSFFQNLFSDPGHMAQKELTEQAIGISPQTLINYTYAMRDRPDRMPFLASYNGKVTYIAGAKDPLIPLELIQNQAVVLGAKAAVAVLAEAAHMGPVEQEKDTLIAIQKFLSHF